MQMIVTIDCIINFVRPKGNGNFLGVNSNSMQNHRAIISCKGMDGSFGDTIFVMGADTTKGELFFDSEYFLKN